MSVALSASTVKSWFQYRCERKTRYETMTGKERDGIPILRDLVTTPWSQLGNRFERRVVGRLKTETSVLEPTVGEDFLSQALSIAFLQSHRPEQYASQLLLEARGPLQDLLKLPDGVAIRRSYADLVKIDHDGPEPLFQVIDIKAAQHATPFHKAQVAFYSLLLQSLLGELNAPGALSRTGQIWCLPPGSKGDDGRCQVEEFRLEPYQRLVMDFFRNEVPSIAKSIVSPKWDSTFFHIYFKCEQCEYLRHCRQAIREDLQPEDRDVSAVAGVSHEAKRSLLGLGISTVGKLAEAQGLRASSGGSWALRRRAESLVRRAQALVADEVQRIPGVASYLMPPRVDVALYLVVDVDPVEDNLITLGYLRSERGKNRHLVEVLQEGSPELESAALCKVLGQLVQDLAEIDRHNAAHEDAPAQQFHAHIFLYEPSEAVDLQDAVGRHLQNALVRTGLLHLVRMFPPEDVVPEPEFRGIHHLPATALRSVIEQLFALPIMVSYDLRQATCALADADPSVSPLYAPEAPFRRPFSSRLSIDVCRELRDGRIEADLVRDDVVARLDAMRALAEWLMRENAAALQREGDHAFLRLNKRPFRFQATLDPLNAVDLDLLRAFELLENRAGMLDALVSLAQPFGQRRDRARCVAQMTLKRHWRTDWGRHSMLFSVPPESRESELSSSNFDLILTDDNPDIRLNPQLWPLFEARIAPERADFATSGTLLVDVGADVFEGGEFQRLLRETGERNWFLDRTFKDVTTARAEGFMAFLGEERV